ncbi:hypothetical protein BJ508DRAFT_134026 [Ascobolus immersus RN42]|uniref:Cora-domain-containing protein n=1 Tax=Ascobolus immersus RN42 TaxID=1160509 RepID=A0A3N4IKQ3_ASCIM|nr:hypothetical protein BJ508DRAFT_134026 [Ascobolus immersus RN42]
MHDVDVLFGFDSLKECKLDLARYFARRHGDRPGAWAENYTINETNATDFIGVTEEYTSMANLFTIDEECTMIWFLAPTWLLLADYPLLSAETQEKGMKRILRTSQNQIAAGDGAGSKRGRNISRDGKVKKHNKVELTAGDRDKVYNPPQYGSRVWYEFPRFFVYTPDSTLNTLAAITAKLRASKTEKWVLSMKYVWHTKKERNEFFDTLDLEKLFEEDRSFRRTLENDIWTIDWRAANKTTIKNGADIFSREALGANRLEKKIKRRLINIFDCRTEILLATMLFMDELERDQLIRFLNHIRMPDTHKMDLNQLTLMPENLWITEFNISFVSFLPPHTTGWGTEYDAATLAYAPKRRSKFYNVDPTVPDSELPMLTDSVYAFRFVGDLHDLKWTCWKIRDLGYVEDCEEKAKFLQNRKSDTIERIQDKIARHKQRRVLEGSFVKESLRIIIKETNKILDELDKQMSHSEHTGNDPLIPAMLRNEDLDGENYYVTMNKHGVYYPWIIQLCSTLKDKCVYANNASKKWLDADKTWDFKPRWTERDQADNKEALKKNNFDIARLQAELDQAVRRIRSKSEKVAALKESLASELSLREARTATQQADSINQFTVVTVIFVPLGFATSVVSIQEFEFSDPVAALLWIMIPVTVGTIVFLINLPIIYLHFCLLMKGLQNWLRKNMTSGEIRWEFWSNRSKMLQEAEKRNTTVVNNTIHRTETNWWYWHYFTVFVLVLLPVRELRFAESKEQAS